MFLRAIASIALLSACSGGSSGPAIRFSPPPGFVNVDTAVAGTKAFVNFKTHEKIGLDTKYETPPPNPPPGQHVSHGVVCGDLDSVAWEAPVRDEMWLRYYVPDGPSHYFFAVYTRPIQQRASPAVVRALTSACPDHE